MSSPTLDGFRERFSDGKAPVIVFNKSHSGSRILGKLLDSAGVFMGSHVNESWDSLDLLELVQYLVKRYYPDYSPLWDPSRAPDRELSGLLGGVFKRHLEARQGSLDKPWGWKLCETVYAIPVLDYCFPSARFIHLIRDGRDVAFCDHKAPDDPFWRKVYFNTDRIRTYAGLRLTPQAYRRQSHIFNAVHWMNSVSMGRAFGAMLRERYIEVRYEDFCGDFVGASSRLLSAIGLDDAHSQDAALQDSIHQNSIGKFRSHPAAQLEQVLGIEKPLLLELGYLTEDPESDASSPWRSNTADRLLDRWNRSVKRST